MPAKKKDEAPKEPAKTEEPKADLTAAPTSPESEPEAPNFGGSVSKDGNFTLLYKDNGVVEVSPRPWEGPPALVTRKERIGELIDALKALK